MTQPSRGRQLRLPPICITIAGVSAQQMATTARHARRSSRFIELRLDWLTRPEDGIALIPELLAQGDAIIVIVTCRRKANGGKFRGTLARQFQILEAASRAGAHLIDLEIESAEQAGLRKVAHLREIGRVVLSFHDFERTPPLRSVARRLRRFPADYYKLVPTATRQRDNCAVLELLDAIQKSSERAGQQDPKQAGRWIAFCMGEPGVPSRILSLAHGGAFVYAVPAGVYATPAGERAIPAPGQLDYEWMRNRFRVHRLTPQTKLYGILGSPVAQSISPAVHNAAFRSLKLDAVYLPLLAEDLRDFPSATSRYPLAGVSVTVPHKVSILRHVDRTDRLVQAVGAANTLRYRAGRWEATNSDVAGIEMPLRTRYRLSPLGKLPKTFRALILGSGGAARAAFVALGRLGCRNVSIAGRNPRKVNRLALEMGATPLKWSSLESTDFDLMIHATSVGMWPDVETCLLLPEQLRAGTVFDLVYNPVETRLLRMATEKGIRTITGLEMYLAQAARQIEYWTGQKAPVARLRRAALNALTAKRSQCIYTLINTMEQSDYKSFVKSSRKAKWVQVWRSVPADLLTPVSAYWKLTHWAKPRAKPQDRYSFLFESVEGGETIARYTFMGADPVLMLRFWMDQDQLANKGLGKIELKVAGQRKVIHGDFDLLSKEIFADYRVAPSDELPPFTSGAVGYLGYDMIAMREPVPLPLLENSGPAQPMPDAVLMFYSNVLVFDHVKHQIWIVCNVPSPESRSQAALQQAYRYAELEIAKIEKALQGPLSIPKATVRSTGSSRRVPAIRSNISRQKFLDSVRKAKRHIRAGDIFQVVLSQRLETDIEAHPFQVYRALRRVNPAPYLFYMQLGDASVLGSSPEMLVKVGGDDVEYRPIAGTRPRGASVEEDKRLEQELLADEKERAEHVMLVDLARNDVGRVSEYGSVRVPEMMFVERYSHVMHLVSSVRGKLRKGLDAWDSLWACFPAGTVSGAPKVRAMQIISELEPTRRGIYAGTVLYYDLSGNLNSCIAIRAIVIRKGKAYVQVGAGIVADSVPEREYEETMNKGKAMLQAIDMAHGDPGRVRPR